MSKYLKSLKNVREMSQADIVKTLFNCIIEEKNINIRCLPSYSPAMYMDIYKKDKFVCSVEKHNNAYHNAYHLKFPEKSNKYEIVITQNNKEFELMQNLVIQCTWRIQEQKAQKQKTNIFSRLFGNNR